IADLSCDQRLQKHPPDWPILETSSRIRVFGLRKHAYFGKLLLETEDLHHACVSNQVECGVNLVELGIAVFDRNGCEWVHIPACLVDESKRAPQTGPHAAPVWCGSAWNDQRLIVIRLVRAVLGKLFNGVMVREDVAAHATKQRNRNLEHWDEQMV